MEGRRIARGREIHLRCGEDAAAWFAPQFVGLSTERLAVAHLTADCRVLGLTESSGDAGMAPLPIRDIVRDALRWEAKALLIAHNHPSGDPRPSSGDLCATRRLARVVEAIGIVMIDHLVFAGTEWRSLRAMGLL